MTRWLVTGAAGQLGTDIVELLHAYREDVMPCDRRALDITDADDVEQVLDDAKPTVVINCAAYTEVDAAETDEATATRINGDGPGHLARWCRSNDARLIHVSTDYVFSGIATAPYEVDHPIDPQSALSRRPAATRTSCGPPGFTASPARTSSRRWPGWPASARRWRSLMTSTAHRPGRCT